MNFKILKSILSLLFLSMMFVGCKHGGHSHEHDHEHIQTDQTAAEEEPMLVGAITKKDLLEAPYKTWFDEEYNAYQVDIESLKGVTDAVKDKKIKVFLGTWCSDSQREMPHFYKILEHLNYDESMLEVIALDRDKITPDNKEEGWNIEFVPTFLFLDGDKELGRIIESPVETLEKDMVGILKP